MKVEKEIKNTVPRTEAVERQATQTVVKSSKDFSPEMLEQYIEWAKAKDAELSKKEEKGKLADYATQHDKDLIEYNEYLEQQATEEENKSDAQRLQERVEKLQKEAMKLVEEAKQYTQKEIAPKVEAAAAKAKKAVQTFASDSWNELPENTKEVLSIGRNAVKEYGPTVILTTASVAYNVGYGVAKGSYYAAETAYPYLKAGFNYCADALNSLKESASHDARFEAAKTINGEALAYVGYGYDLAVDKTIEAYEANQHHFDNAAEVAHELSEYVIDNAVEVFGTLDEYSQEIGFGDSLSEELMHDACGF